MRSRRYATLALTLAATLGAGGVLVGACYDVPQPICGFRCGPADECPADYTCDPTDGRCHLDGAPAMVCGTLDAGPDIDGAPGDGELVDAMPDAVTDAMPDATADAAPDAMPDAMPDAL